MRYCIHKLLIIIRNKKYFITRNIPPILISFLIFENGNIKQIVINIESYTEAVFIIL